MRAHVSLVLIFLFLTSCTTRIPEPVNHQYSQQKKMQASHHWQVLANDLANRINNGLILSDNIDTSVFVEETCGDEGKTCGPRETSAFNEAFRDLLITNLVSYGIPTNSKADEQAIKIQYKVQVVRHNAARFRTLQPGLLTALSAAIVVLRNAPSNLVILATGAALDLANASIAVNGKYEIIITTSMVNEDKYLFRASDIYYINDKDFMHYQENKTAPTTIKLSSNQKASLAQPTWTSRPMLPIPPASENGSSKEMGKGI